MKEFLIAGFGEVMLRLSPEGKKRFSQVLPGELQASSGKLKSEAKPISSSNEPSLVSACRMINVTA